MAIIIFLITAYTIAVFFCAYNFAKLTENNIKLKVALKSFEILNGLNVAARDIENPIIKDASTIEKIPINWLKAVLKHENGPAFYEAGCKKYFIDLKKYPIEQWQTRTAARIISQEYIAFMNEREIEDKFSVYLYKRYYSADKEAARDVVKIKRQYDKEAIK